MNEDLLRNLLIASGVLHGCVALLNLSLPRVMGWARELDRLPLLIREVFRVHLWFISITCATFAYMTLRFAAPMAAGVVPALASLAGCIALFWGMRTVIQVAYYSSSHWRGRPLRLAAHAGLLLLYGSFTAVYATTALRGM